MPTPFSIGSFTTPNASISPESLCDASAQPNPADRLPNHDSRGYDACPADKLGQRDRVAHISTATTATKSSVTSIGRLTTASTRCHKTIGQHGSGTGRHHPGILGAIIPE